MPRENSLGVFLLRPICASRDGEITTLLVPPAITTKLTKKINLTDLTVAILVFKNVLCQCMHITAESCTEKPTNQTNHRLAELQDI